jgi:uncharacterized membrane protein YesL
LLAHKFELHLSGGGTILFRLQAKKCFWDIYDHLGAMISYNLVWMLAFFLPAVFFFLFPSFFLCWLVFFIFISGPATGALFFAQRILVKEERFGLKIWTEGFKKYFWESIFFTTLYLFLSWLVKLNLDFFQLKPPPLPKGLNKVISSLNLVIILFFFFSQNYTFPLMVFDFKIKDIFKYSFFLSFGYFRFTLFLSSQIFFTFLLLLVSGLGFLLFAGSFLAIFQLNGLIILFSQHQGIELEEKYYRKIRDILRETFQNIKDGWRR